MNADTMIIVGQSWSIAAMFYNGPIWLHATMVLLGVVMTLCGLGKAATIKTTMR